jgi:hypothetical protein
LHFDDSDFITDTQDHHTTKARGKRETGLQLCRLKKDACPTRFPNLATYFSTEKPEPRSGRATSSARWEADIASLEEASATFLEQVHIMKHELKYHVSPSWVMGRNKTPTPLSLKNSPPPLNLSEILQLQKHETKLPKMIQICEKSTKCT